MQGKEFEARLSLRIEGHQDIQVAFRAGIAPGEAADYFQPPHTISSAELFQIVTIKLKIR
ncbi:MAG: hypothetical protein A3F83_10760 [Candidatus Glassbacteria bacterium RIFCSPLOWO2_12_FULL_58_11]|uniref:Uncharacterized protein n=1 Tax=Candidatus Glassbacteria bacterium RIFCSPLOWO2_12_FULL_58_11 TaxID=1817867 RepID=A0A1F5Z129_9BACT|nr:MAG: hypothetical protein A3F83_10760 [Candidatus Glassbacteria bacterium RIFCSPLOWO2_12_FULL_58_11]